jgi:hypothetical protein
MITENDACTDFLLHSVISLCFVVHLTTFVLLWSGPVLFRVSHGDICNYCANPAYKPNVKCVHVDELWSYGQGTSQKIVCYVFSLSFYSHVCTTDFLSLQSRTVATLDQTIMMEHLCVLITVSALCSTRNNHSKHDSTQKRQNCCSTFGNRSSTIMIVSIPIRILLSYDFTILPRSIDTYRDGILI